jgi:hypothetical protein
MASTVDILIESEWIVEYLEYCCVHYSDYGSDHRPIALSYLGGIPPGATQRGKRLSPIHTTYPQNLSATT